MPKTPPEFATFEFFDDANPGGRIAYGRLATKSGKDPTISAAMHPMGIATCWSTRYLAQGADRDTIPSQKGDQISGGGTVVSGIVGFVHIALCVVDVDVHSNSKSRSV